MAKFRKKPVVIEAFQMTRARRADNIDWPEWLNRAWNEQWGQPGSVAIASDGSDRLVIHTLEGVHLVDWDDWIIQGVKGELYPCKPDIFAATYQRKSMASWAFFVAGPPSTKGSGRVFVNKKTGKAIYKHDNDTLKPWTARLQWSAREKGIRLAMKGVPVSVSVIVALERPASVTRDHAVVKPDSDKVLRAIFDALSGVAYTDDCQVVTHTFHKRYVEGPEVAGTHIVVSHV